MPTPREILGSLVGIVFEYDTPKFVHIRNKKIGAINRLIQLGIIIGMIVGIIIQESYLESAPLVSTITTKVKGAQNLLSNKTYEWRRNCFNSTDADYMLDHADLVVPPQEPNSFFVTTNLWMTCNQVLGVCPEDTSVKDSNCTNNNDCPKNDMLEGGNGITTGNCSGNDTDPGTCEVTAWCPVENENDTITDEGPKIDTRNFTVSIKNSISCPVFNEDYIVRNVQDVAALKTCHYDNSTEKGKNCSKFSLGQIVGMINGNPSYDELATKGAVVGLQIKWSGCNVDSSSDNCRPTYSARRLDKSKSGYNFRYPHYHYIDGVQYRDLVKAYGILFVVQVTGECHQISYVNIVTKLGSTIALLAIATVVCDILVLYTPKCILSKSKLYREKKYQNVDIQEANNSGEHNYGAISTDSDTVNKPVD